MGNFDDVLALEDGDDWDDYDPTSEQAAVSGLAPTVMTLTSHGVEARLRGQVPDAVVRAFSSVHDRRPVSAGVDLVFSADHPEDNTAETGAITDRSGQELATWGTDRSVIQALRSTLVDRLRSIDDHVVRVTAAVVAERGDRRAGVVLVHPDDAVRHRLVADICTTSVSGAAELTADELVMIPGSRTVYGTPLPHLEPPSSGASRTEVGRTEVGRTEAGSIEASGDATRADRAGAGEERAETEMQGGPVARDGAVVHRVVFIDTGDGPAGVETLSVAEGLATWFDNDPSILQRYGPGALDVLATATMGAEFRTVRADSVSGYVEGVLAANTSEVPATALVTLHRFDRPTAGEGPAVVGGPRQSLRVARVDEGGVLLDGASGVITVLDGDEMGALEAAATTPPGRGRGVAGPMANERLARLRDLGVDLSVLHGRPSEAEAYALPNSSLASSATARRPAKAPSPETAVLETAVGAVRAAGVEPVVLGAIVTAHDSTAPAAAVEVDRVDLLIEPSDLAAVVSALDSAGFEQRSGRAEGEERAAASAVTLLAPAEIDEGMVLRLHVRLSAGPFSELVDHDEVRSRAVPILVDGFWCTALHPVDRFVQACVRYQQRGTDQRIAREIVLSAPRLEPVMTEALEASERWGSTRDVLEALRRVDATLPGLSPWLVERATRNDVDRRGRRRRRR